MVKDAEAHAEEDKRLHELVETRNRADALVHSVKKSLAEHGDKVEAGEKDAIESAIKALEEALKGDDKAAMDAKAEALATASQKMGERMYADAQAAAGTAAGGTAAGGADAAGSSKPAEENVVDAEFTEVKDKK
jgi:molecular chaperone DnaK